MRRRRSPSLKRSSNPWLSCRERKMIMIMTLVCLSSLTSLRSRPPRIRCCMGMSPAVIAAAVAAVIAVKNKANQINKTPMICTLA